MKYLVITALLSFLSWTASSQTTLQPADMKYDLAILRSSWEVTHPGLYRYNTKEDIDRYFSQLDQKTNESLTLREFFVLLSQLNAKIHCGHTFVSYYNNKKALKEELYSRYFMPVLFRVLEGKMIITHNLTDDPSLKPGGEITAINDVPVRAIIDSLLTVSKADGKNGLNKQLDNITIYKRDISTRHYCLFDIYFPLFFKKDIQTPDYMITVKSGRKSKRIAVVGISKEERELRYKTRYGEVPKDQESWSVREIDTKTVVFRLGDFATYNWKFDFYAYLDSVFTSFQKKGYTNLILDIRENEGGADEARDAVLSYITDKPIGCANPVRRLYSYINIPDSLKPHLDTWDDSFKNDKTGYHRTLDGYYELDNGQMQCDSILPRPNHFRGRIFLITDATNSSATFIMADCVKSNHLGVLVGEKTGGTQQGINGAQILFLYLPKSQVEMDLPLIWQRPYTDRPDEGILPDFEVKTTARHIRKKEDPQLQFILKSLVK